MKIASWNINSIKVRLPNILKWLEIDQPDILFMQELKGIEENFPVSDFNNAGYEIVINAQKTYNGVAIASKYPITFISDTILDGDEQARYLEVEINGIRMINVYCPNGNPVDSEKYPYKLRWMDELIKHLISLKLQSIPFLIGGDFNIIPTNNDCYDPASWEGDALFRPETLEKWRTLKNIGLYDAYRMKQPHEMNCFTFWDYQAGAWQQNKGIRIDHFLLSPTIADQLKYVTIQKQPRGWEKPSDHTPIIIEI